MDLFVPGPYLPWQVVYQKRKLSKLLVSNQWRGKYGYFNKSVYVDCMGKQVVVQTVHTFGSTSQVTILCQLFLPSERVNQISIIITIYVWLL